MAGQVPHHQHNGHRGAAERTAASGTHAHAHAHAHGAIPFVLAVPCALLGLLSRAAGVVSGHASVSRALRRWHAAAFPRLPQESSPQSKCLRTAVGSVAMRWWHASRGGQELGGGPTAQHVCRRTSTRTHTLQISSVSMPANDKQQPMIPQ